MRLLSASERRVARILLRFRLLSHAGFGDHTNTAMLIALTPLLGFMVAVVELGIDPVPLLPFMPGLYLALTALAGVAAVFGHAAPEVAHPGGSILATAPRVSPASRYADASTSLSVWLIAASALFALGPFAGLQAVGHTESAQAVLSMATMGPLLALSVAGSQRLRLALLPRHIAFRWAGWVAISLFAVGPVAAAAMGAAPNGAALWGGPLWIVFAALSFGAQGGLAQFAVVYLVLLAAALGHGLIPPRFAKDALEKSIAGATRQQEETVEKLLEQFETLKEERFGEDVAAIEFGGEPRQVFKALTPPPESPANSWHKQVRNSAKASSVVLVLGIVCVWVLQNGPALRSVGWFNLSVGGYFVVLALVVALRFPGRSLEAKIEGATDEFARLAATEKKERTLPDVNDVHGWDILATLPVPRDLLEEVYMGGYRRGLFKVPVVAGGAILFMWVLTGSLLGAAQLVLSFGVTMGAMLLAVQAAMSPCHRRRRFLRYAYLSGVAAWAVGGFAITMPAVLALGAGLEVRLDGAEVLYAAACGLMVAVHLFLHGVYLRESLTVCGRPYADWARVGLTWAMGAALFGVTAYVSLVRLTS